MAELESSAKRMQSAYEADINGVHLVVQYIHDDRCYWGFGFDQGGKEIAFAGPFPEMKPCLGRLGHEVRKAGFWQEE